ncbi:hypothetical protein [Pseudomonas sp. NMI760_13]|uniref:hypothetical protein n=1 Tax=Pseudomonas sp. NMI760_13 TaxID=2903147 RepID=UPI001E3968D3|nr:hypothetical protein [Pseudomonas sp. NMI760_13]MCE0913015.1 hypothetical protein [Pseudomonas sp. NMI760_13]
MQIPDRLVDLLVSSVSSATIVGAVAWLLKSWIGERLRAGIKHEYDDRLEQLKADLKKQGDENLAVLKSEIDRQAEKLKIASASFSDVQRAVIHKKISAVECLWLAVIEMRRLTPAPIITSEVLTRSELIGAYEGPLGDDIRAIEFGLATKFFGEVENHRPFLGEVVWSQFASMASLMSRIVYLFRQGRVDPEKLVWYEDQGVLQIVLVLFGADLAEEFRNLKHSYIRWLNAHFDQQLFSTIDVFLSGREFGEAALKHAEFALGAITQPSPVP